MDQSFEQEVFPPLNLWRQRDFWVTNLDIFFENPLIAFMRITKLVKPQSEYRGWGVILNTMPSLLYKLSDWTSTFRHKVGHHKAHYHSDRTQARVIKPVSRISPSHIATIATSKSLAKHSTGSLLVIFGCHKAFLIQYPIKSGYSSPEHALIIQPSSQALSLSNNP